MTDSSTMNVQTGARKLRVAFDCLGAAPLFMPLCRDGIGGAEVRAYTFARQLAQHDDLALQFIVRDAQAISNVEGILLKPNSQATRGEVASLRIGLQRNLQRLKSSIEKRCWEIPERRPFYEKLSVDVLCCFGVTNHSAGVVRSAKRAGIATILFLTSDRTLDDLKRQGRHDRGAYGEIGFMCRYAVEHADRIVVQTESQRTSLRSTLNRESSLIRNPIDLHCVASEIDRDIDVLWVGRADNFSKRADRAIEIARFFPDRRFTLIMNRHDERLFAELCRQRPANVEIVEQVPYQEVEGYFARARTLLNTSVAEGFPNTFLQAAKYGLPIVSLEVDPDGVLQRHSLGASLNGDMEATAAYINAILDDDRLYHTTSERVRQYVGRYHALEDRAADLHRLLRDVGVAHGRDVKMQKGIAA